MGLVEKTLCFMLLLYAVAAIGFLTTGRSWQRSLLWLMPEENAEKSRISKIHIGRVFNLTNYQNVRYEIAYEITIDVGTCDSPAELVRNAEKILNNLYWKADVSESDLSRAREILAKSSEQLTDKDIQNIPNYREVIAKLEEQKQRRKAARDALDTLNFTSEYKDAKTDWDDDWDDETDY